MDATATVPGSKGTAFKLAPRRLRRSPVPESRVGQRRGPASAAEIGYPAGLAFDSAGAHRRFGQQRGHKLFADDKSRLISAEIRHYALRPLAVAVTARTRYG
jgi:hypothetical protein